MGTETIDIIKNLEEYDQNISLLTKSGYICKDKFQLPEEVIKMWHNDLTTKMKELLKNINHLSNEENTTNDNTIETGYPGVCYTMFKIIEYSEISSIEKDEIIGISHELLSRLIDKFEFNLTMNPSKPTYINVSFLTGDVGPLCLLAYFYFKFDSLESPRSLINLVDAYITLITETKEEDSFHTNIYDLSGYLFSLLFICHNINRRAINRTKIDQVCAFILQTGTNRVSKIEKELKLNYFYENTFLECIQSGICLILYHLIDPICAITPSVKRQLRNIKEAVDSIFVRMNEIENLSIDLLDKTVSGISSMVYLAIRCHRVFKELKYINYATKLGDFICEKYTTIKSLGLWNGLTCFGYSLIALYNYTSNKKYLYYALKLAEGIIQMSKTGKFDNISLKDGEAGILYFLLDIQKPSCAKMPGIQAYTDIPVDITILFIEEDTS